MSHSTRGECDDKVKNIIHHLYKVRNLPLQGSDQSVKEIMKQKYGFDRTKQQYEKLLGDWGFTKKRKREDYQTIEWKVQKRSKASAVYLDGKLLPVKTWRRQGSMTVPERMKLDQELPEMPTGFEIRTPTAQPLYHLDFWSLPILHFQSGFNIMKDTIEISEKTFEKLIPIQRGLEKSNRPAFMPLLSTLLPLGALRDEPAATLLTIDRIESLGSNEFLALTVYLMSNNFFGEPTGREAYRWLKSGGKARTSAIIQMFASVDGFTSKALLENIFRLAVVAGDISTVETLLDAGVEPNGHRLSHSKIPDTMDPLQFACVTGNFGMAQMLIKAGSNVQILESKDELSFWKRSLIVLAIIGESDGLSVFSEDEKVFSDIRFNDENICGDDLEDNISNGSGSTCFRRMNKGGTKPNRVGMLDYQPEQVQATFFEFIGFLIDEGAKVNVASIRDSIEDNFESGYPACLSASHSPLTAASKYRHGQVVRLLLEHGADTMYLIDGETNALQECLCKVYVFKFGYGFHVGMSKSGSLGNENLPDIVRDLVNAGIGINTSVFYGCNSDYAGDCDCGVCLAFSPMDLAVFTGMTEVIEILFDAGANFSTHCLQYATTFAGVDVVEWLLDHGATMPYEPANIFSHVDDDVNIKAVLKRCSDRSTKRCAMLTAIILDSTSLMNCVMALDPFDWASLYEFPEFLSATLEKLLIDTFEPGYPRTLIVLSKILELNSLDVLELWQHLNLSVSNALNIDPELKMGIGKIYGELARAALRAGIPMHTSKNCCMENCQYLPGEAMLIIAAQIADDELISLLVDAGVNINAFGKIFCGIEGQHYETPLTTAIKARSWDLVDYLLKAGANVNNPVSLPGDSQNLALCAAMSQGNDVLVRQLLHLGAQFDLETVQNLGEFTEYDPSFQFYGEVRRVLITNPELFSILLAHLHPSIGTPIWHLIIPSMIFMAVEIKDPTLLRTVLDILKQSPTSGLPSVTQALGDMLADHHHLDSRILNLLLDAGANVNGVLQRGSLEYIGSSSILHLAVESRQFTKIEAILKAGGDPNRSLQPTMESTVLQSAIALKDNDIIGLLLKYGADPNTSSTYQKPKYPLFWGTPLQMAVERAKDKSVRKLLNHNADPNRTNQFVAHTPLQIAARKGLEPMVTILIEYGANVNAPAAADHGATALQYAVIGGFFGIAYTLVQNGADVNAASAEVGGRTALQAAAEHGRIDIARYLLNVGAEVHGSGQQQYERALEFASNNGHHSIRELLEEYHG